MRTALKALVFCLASYATWAATSAIVGQPRRADASAQPVQAAVSSVKKFSTTQPPPPIPLGASGAYAEYYLRSHQISVQDGMATIKAHVSLADQRPGISYVWRARVVDSREEPLAGTVYDQQMFSVEANGQREADFTDVIDVPPGAARVELSLFAVFPGEDLSFLDDQSKWRQHEQIRAVKLLK